MTLKLVGLSHEISRGMQTAVEVLHYCCKLESFISVHLHTHTSPPNSGSAHQMSYLGQAVKRPRVEDEGTSQQNPASERYACTADHEQSFTN
jgi:hypothetical protein